MQFAVGQTVITSTGTATVVRGPYTRYRQEWYDIVEIPEHTKEEGN